ncbi:MAG: protein-L-isoaspartate(D-aspartate) O-methyltransferase [Candidatus Dormibacteraeota bacterium]|uniref:Protein-L-isoaspartate O-methyltransferase n=1 Tax=Candidatus Amunia macphersoniae TaxID=3127014 RepID=A0A934NJX5_9BACT|nr:protein-L-isoaspartate(D-aspartate) O-methyltransferase [Candidatus Dormibacteraeota bacterium]
MLDTLRRGGIRDTRVLEAMAAVPRELFVPAALVGEAYADRALAIECGQSISQPLMVAAVAQALELTAGDTVLDVGTGSGYQAAVLCACGGRVVGIERVPELADSARRRLAALGIEVTVHVGDGSGGLPDRAPFDAIAVAATAPRMPVALPRQLREGGRLVIPLHREGDEMDELVRLRMTEGRWVTQALGPCRFVPMIGTDAYPPG